MKKNRKHLDTEYNIETFDYDLPANHIAQAPTQNRDGSRLMVVNCQTETIEDLHFYDIVKLLRPNDLLVINDTKVFPARIRGKKETGGQVELFLLAYPDTLQVSNNSPVPSPDDISPDPSWSQTRITALLKSSKRPRPGTRLLFSDEFEALVEKLLPHGKVQVLLRFRGQKEEILSTCGQVPLPPYIRRKHGEFAWDHNRYQTLFARQTGAVAAPTAGLHFSENLLGRIKEKKVNIAPITLHVGYGTFAPVRTRDIRRHRIHEEYVIVSKQTAQLVNKTIKEGGNIWVVGTTTARTLEFAADDQGRVHETEGWCNLYIYPGYEFKVVKNLITNFHLPRSSLLFFTAALAGRERILSSYEQAVRLNYRFYSYGDAMVILT